MKEQFQYIMKLCSLFLQYPDSSWVRSEEIKEMLDLIEDGPIKESLLSFNGYLSEHLIDQLCEHYVNTFDLNDKTTLYLTYYQLKDQKERGQALLQIKEIYSKAGLEINSTELPDYLPMILEFIAIAPTEIAQEMMIQQMPNMEKLNEELVKNQNPYRYILQACLMTIQTMMQPNRSERLGGVSS
ncbi:nitrate reductase molybdenum cofactor assembly chaperone [Tepidibacillus sp. LV47]|uniref:nitrate reductase molybdenum cofactor assembly chaperone n=1 Tax=Tepidibacillus sp. LV47 TaxID=3398228 RepID=UPI003AAE2505